jgi:hypothetical protein
MLSVHYPVCPHPRQFFPLFFFDDAIAEFSWESPLVLAALEDDRVIYPSHHDRVKNARGWIWRGWIWLGTEFKNIL